MAKSWPAQGASPDDEGTHREEKPKQNRAEAERCKIDKNQKSQKRKFDSRRSRSWVLATSGFCMFLLQME